MKNIFTLLLASFSIVGMTQSIDNQVIASSGGTLENGNSSLNSTIGEVATETYTANGATLTQGFHQPAFHITSILEHNDRAIDLTVYPNPTVDVVKISTSLRGIKYNMVDMNGKLLTNGIFKENMIEIDLTQFPAGVFFINVHSKKHDFAKTYQVVKK
jgi:hypothetical protein